MARETGTKPGNVIDRATNGKGDGNKTGKCYRQGDEWQGRREQNREML